MSFSVIIRLFCDQEKLLMYEIKLRKAIMISFIDDMRQLYL